MSNNQNNANFFFEKQRSSIQRPFTLMPKCVGPICNLDCDYCYYLDKEALFGGKKSSVRNFTMDRETLAHTIKNYIESQPTQEVNFVWHGGEPTLLGVDYFKEMVKLQDEFANGKKINNSFQTNGTLLNDEWAAFLAEHNFLVGISIDGPKRLHDHHRKYSNGMGSWDRVMQGAGFLHKHGVEFNTMSVVNATNCKHPVAIYDFMKEIGSTFIQFSPIVERIAADENELLSLVPNEYGKEADLMRENVTANEWGNFLCRIFDRWVKTDVGSYYVNIFDNTLAGYVGESPSLCTMSKYCCCAPVVEHNGDVFCCDHFVFPEFKVGNIFENNIAEMMKSDKQLFFEEEKERSLSKQCRACDYLAMCGGDCPKNRIATNLDGEKISALCQGFQMFFNHTRKHFEFMANELRYHRAPANIMKANL